MRERERERELEGRELFVVSRVVFLIILTNMKTKKEL
jgi:hypothetical protein